MVGRDQELALRARALAAGRGRRGPGGAPGRRGRHRQVAAGPGRCSTRSPRSEHVALRYQCSPHHTGTALWPVIQQLGFAAGLEPADAEAAKLDKLEALLRQGVEDVGEAAPLIAALLGIDAGARYPAQDLTPQQRRARTLAVLVEQLLGLARRRPGADGGRGRALDRPHHPRAPRPGPRPDRGRAGADAADEPAGQPAEPGRAPARDAAHAQPPRPRPDRGDRRAPGRRQEPAARGAGARSRPGPTGCRCSSRS